MTDILIVRPRAAAPSLRALLTAGSAMIAFLPGAALAQTPPATAKADDEIIVTASRPIAESERAALDIQRKSDSLISVVAADSVGRLPDQNIAAAVGRLPGVGVVRDQGQARYITLRGAPLNWSTLSFNGVNIVSPEGRDARYDSIPSAIASQVIVRKAVTAEMTSETIAGNIDVVTRSALDYQGFHFQGKLGAGKGDLGNKDELEGFAVVSNRWETGIGDIGILVSGSYYARGIATDNVETDFEQVTQDTRPGNADRFWARETERKFYRATRRNYSASGRLDWRPDTDSRYFIESVYTAFTDQELRDNYIFDFDDQQGSTATGNALRAACGPTNSGPNPPVGTTGYADTCIGNSSFAGTVYGIDINANILRRRFVQSIFTNTIGGDVKFGEGWKLMWRGNYTRSLDDRSAPAQFNFDSAGFGNVNRPTVSYSVADPLSPSVSLFRTNVGTGNALSRGAAVANIQDFALPLSRVRSLDANDTTKAYTARFELAKETSLFGAETEIKIGFQYDSRTKESVENLLDLNLTQANTAGIANTIQAYTNAGSYIGKIAPGYAFQYYNEPFLIAERDKALAAGFTRNFSAANYYNVNEKVLSGYLMATSRFNWGSVIGGVRVENVKNTGNAFLSPGTAAQRPVTAQNSATNFFPSLHINVNVADDKKLRVGFTSGAARADYDQLRPNVTINDANLTISGGNPALKPERAYGVDAYLEWFVQPQGYFMLGAYYKRVEDVLFTSRRTFGSNALDSGGVDRSGYVFSGLINGGSGYILGAEAAVQVQIEPYTEQLGLPEWMGGFGVSANATYNKSSVTKPTVFDGAGAVLRAARKVSLPGTSEVIYNVGAYYEKYGLSLRVQYQKRTPWGDFVADTLVDGGDGFWDTDDELDISARYEVLKGFEVYVDASNLLNGPGRRYTNDSRYTIEYERFGRRFTGGVRVNF
jgi:TonB-dependent receptor